MQQVQQNRLIMYAEQSRILWDWDKNFNFLVGLLEEGQRTSVSEAKKWLELIKDSNLYTRRLENLNQDKLKDSSTQTHNIKQKTQVILINIALSN